MCIHIHVYQKTFMRMFTTALFIEQKPGGNLTSPVERINYTMEYYSAMKKNELLLNTIQMNLTDIKLSEKKIIHRRKRVWFNLYKV